MKLVISFLLIGIAFANGIPLRNRQLARQIEATTPIVTIAAKTPYPAAGYRPKIPFDLPNEVNRQPKLLPDASKPSIEVPIITTTATTTTTSPIVETFGVITPKAFAPITQRPLTPSTSSVEEQYELDSSPNIPAETYGVPRPQSDTSELVDNNVDDVLLVAPQSHFQPPIRDAVANFDANNQNQVVDIEGPTRQREGIAKAGDETETETGAEGEGELESESEQVELGENAESHGFTETLLSNGQAVEATSPPNVYGPPIFAADGRQVPAFTYGPPNVVSQLDAAEAAENELLPVAESGARQSGRLVFVPADGSRLRPVYLADPISAAKQTARPSKLQAPRRARIQRNF